MSAELLSPEGRLAELNERLAALLHREPIALDAGAAQTLADPLWVWGVVGGKDVGKTTLINALAGAPIVDAGLDVGEGTYQPAAYLTAADEPALAARFAARPDIRMMLHASAPASMRRLVLVDLPDFDSIFTDHVAIVRRLSGVLDGIIWVVSPKKVADLEAIRRARDLLKDRGNFVYVVNKVDWLLAQSPRPPEEELQRLASALRTQVDGAAGGDEAGRAFFIAARYRTPQEILAAISAARGQGKANGAALTAAAGRLVEEFANLRAMLTTPPAADAAVARKQANLTYQTSAQASRMLEVYRPRAVLGRVQQALAPQRLSEIFAGFFPPDYVAGLASRLQGDRHMVADWAGQVFERRLARWSVLGTIAWPVMAFGNLLRRRTAGWGAASAESSPQDIFRRDGIDLSTRVQDLASAVRSRLADLPSGADMESRSAVSLAADLRRAAEELREADRASALGRYLEPRPNPLGALYRRLLPVFVLLWFPFIQPIAAGLLAMVDKGLHLDAGTWLALVQALSGGRVLSGLGASLVLLAMLTAAVYAGARRDAARAWAKLESRDPDALAEMIRNVVLLPLIRPAESFARELEQVTSEVEGLGGQGGAPTQASA